MDCVLSSSRLTGRPRSRRSSCSRSFRFLFDWSFFIDTSDRLEWFFAFGSNFGRVLGEEYNQSIVGFGISRLNVKLRLKF